MDAGEKRQDPAHRATHNERYGVESVREQFLALGDGAEEFLAGVGAKRARSAGLWLRLILALKAHYHADDIATALNPNDFKAPSPTDFTRIQG